MIRESRINRRALKIGDTFKTNNYGVLRIIGYSNTECKYKVEFIATGYQTFTTICKIRKGRVKDKLFPNVSGVGFIGDGEYSCKSHKRIYDKWKHMLARCYSGKYPEYENCFVCHRWFNFQNFANDVSSLPGYQSDLRGLDLDKDTRVAGNKIYSPATCCFIPHRVNFNHALRRNKG